MIALLRGTVVSITAGELILDVNGVGYQVRVPIGARLAGAGEELTIHTYLAVREDAMELYGFTSAQDRQVFITLIGVSGVGPKTALAAIDTLGGADLAIAVVNEDYNTITQVPGIGKKGAQRMVLEIKEKMKAFAAFQPGTPATTPKSTAGHGMTAARADALMALVSLGFSREQAQQQLADVDPSAPVEEQIRIGLKSS